MKAVTIALLLCFVSCTDLQNNVEPVASVLSKQTDATFINLCKLSLNETGDFFLNSLTGDSMYAQATGTTSVRGKKGNGRHFANHNDKISFNDPSGNNLTLSGAVIQFWFKSELINHAALVGKGHQYEHEFSVILEPDGSLRFDVDLSDTNEARTAVGYIVPGQWYFVNAIWNGDRLDLFINRQLAAFKIGATAAITVGETDYNIGWVEDGYFKGTIDEVSIFLKTP